MCGIVGIIRKDGSILPEEIQTMRDVFPYRGPDDYGFWISADHRVALGHRRLSILDVTSKGHQPMHHLNLIIVYNGEIYNYIELREFLKKKGYVFRSSTDTEVVLAAYKEWGVNCLDHFNGMFAFAIWDESKKCLFLARDRIGIKPLYYYHDTKSFYFASEIKAILRVLKEKPKVRGKLIDAYMDFGYVPGEDTLLTGIQRLLPGYYKLVGYGNSTIRKYWELDYQNKEDLGLRYYLDRTSELLEESINLRLRSDVPLGIFLSGGIDSSTVVALLSNGGVGALKTFSVAYDFGPGYDETPYARIVARKFKTDHHEIFLTPSQFRDSIPKYVWLMDEPVTESAAISLYFVSRLAKDYVTVVLSGEGADEIFAGYDFYRYMLLVERVRDFLGCRTTKFISELARSYLPRSSKISKYIILASLPLEQRYKGISTYAGDYKRFLYSKDFQYYISNHKDTGLESFLSKLFEHSEHNDPLSKMLYFDIKTWLVDDLLIKADRMSMAASLELRVPFLDHKLVEFSSTIPSKYKLNWRGGKYILKRLMADSLPREIISRKKMGFPTPLKVMFKKYLFDYATELLLSSRALARGYFAKNSIEKMLQLHRKGTGDYHRQIWQLVVLEEWHRTFVD